LPHCVAVMSSEMVTMTSRQIDVVDVVVVGFGAAGATAAITAKAAGAEVVVVEKAPWEYRGGNSRVSGQIVFWPNDIAKAVQYFKALASPYLDRIPDTMIEVWATEMYANRAWLESLGMQVATVQSTEFPEFPGSDCVEVLLHRHGSYGGARLWDQVIEPAFAATGIHVLYDTPALRLLTMNGAVSGVEVRQDGRIRGITARRGVVLASGGFQADQAMIRTYFGDLPYCHLLGTPYNTGDGIRMAMGVGADLWHMNNMAGPNLSFRAQEFPVAARLGTIKADSYLYVAADGRRFVSEASNFKVEKGRQHSPIKHGKILNHGRFVQYPCPVPIHLVFDETVRKAGGLCAKAAGFAFGWDVIHGDLYGWSTDNQREIERGWIKQADTVAALGAAIGLPAGVLEDTVGTFNAACAAGIDRDFGRNALAPLITPPFYALELGPASLNTQGGPVRNERAEIISVDGHPIPRLYSAGELGSIYSYRYQAGGNLGECFAFGRIAGRNAASHSPLEDGEP
jgi:succinate dehydrogenase/fumarate reductase flavoprotein subunit